MLLNVARMSSSCFFTGQLFYVSEYAILREISAVGDRGQKELSFPWRGRWGFCSLLGALSEREAAFPIVRCNRACRTELLLVRLENMDFLLFRAVLLDGVGDAIGRKGVSLFQMQFLFSGNI